MLLTSEPVHGLKDARRIIGYYENRWLIEEFHKAWKTGCRMEERRFQDAHTLERMLVILAFVAVRMLQLRASAALNPDIDACEILHEDELKLLAGLAKKRKRKTPKKKTAQWAMGEIASLVGWFKTKQNPRPGWQSLWKGWAKYTSMFDGYTLAKELQEM